MAARVLVVQHQDSCPPALIGEWLTEAGLVLDVRRPDLGEDLPDDLEAHDALLVLGGAMDAVDEAGHPWLTTTVSLLRRAVAEEVPTWGVCLGHQLLARACGGVVDRNPRGRQVGVLPMGWTPAAAEDLLVGDLAAAATAARCLQWNQDIVVEVPSSAVVLARTAADEPQVVRFAPRAWGVQAHPEAGPSLV
ncbi:type 1 glutamine amidotransferase, partial [Nocardioides sp.]|uniref:type 1 glutamine amidotransferase n=1 Tax=Nocardioides sp. TaxID=35761 RepID=UPI002B26CDF4